MIESLKDQLWELLKEKKVSLAMIYNRGGNILWSRGRRILGKSIDNGENFCKSFIRDAFQTAGATQGRDGLVTSGHEMSASAKKLLVKSVLVQPLDNDFFLYIDSGTRDAFSEEESGLFRMLGKMMSDAIRHIRSGEADPSGTEAPGAGASFNQLKERYLTYALEDEPVLLLGETGVGKSFAAELIHRYSGRIGNFVVADVTTVSEALFESYVFGHRKGSFTGALDNKKGLIDEARDGTLFLDEIAEVPASFQAKLLRFIETKKYRVLGEAAEREANVRIIAATNVDLSSAISAKEFREDLYFRLNILQITIPPLRERKEELKPLVNQHLRFLKGKEIGENFWEVLNDYHWPGNLRELLTVLKRAGILCGSPITGDDLRGVIEESISHASPRGEQQAETGITDIIWGEIQGGKTFWEAVKEPFLERDLNRLQVKDIVSRALAKCGGKYVDALPVLNLPANEYKRFMKFLNKNRLQ